MQTDDRQVIFTVKARCRDCNRCVRNCPVKAIRVSDGQASVVDERCIGCGTCVRECPQGAKQYRRDLNRVQQLMSEGCTMVASLAPSFPVMFPEWRTRRVVSALRRLGFHHVEETAIGAFDVAAETRAFVTRNLNQTWICTACPAVVRYVELYQPELVPLLAPVVSPMIAHARRIRGEKNEKGEPLFDERTKIIFIGPCTAKKKEADRPEFAGLIDAVLTFDELNEWLEEEKIDLLSCEESEFDAQPEGSARLFPLEGGSVRTAGWTTDMLAGDVVAVSGAEEVKTALESIQQDAAPYVLEPLFCPEGCIHGAGMRDTANLFVKRGELLDYANKNPGRDPTSQTRPDLSIQFHAAPVEEQVVTEEQIRTVLEKTGKGHQEDQLNCGACGYPSCREKAIAVIRGLAEPEMCLPHMRRLAEQRVDKILETSPNGFVILDDSLTILHTNAAFRKFFLCSEAIHGKPISYLMDPQPFERLASGGETLVRDTVEHPKYHLVCHEIMYTLTEGSQYVGIFVDVTSNRDNEQKLDRLREKTLLQARELLEHQIQMAEQIAKFLGESTAKGEDLVEKLMMMADEDHPQASTSMSSFSSFGRRVI
ncbi:MAG: [Fe-Fe] hydrogenase large subunit C-terminal domain-containing protein [Thermoguttaceae bacterium]|nr:[Fe-Fe] hydrogenase large subunit C-terminal domain-containing protein [Thermoguttaceae bacterium]